MNGSLVRAGILMVAVGLGWSVLPRTMVDEEVVALPVQGSVCPKALA